MVEPGALNCPYCGSAVDGGAKFCPSCGAPQAVQAPVQPATRYCPNCGNANAATSTFCPRCGTNLQTPWSPQYQPVPQAPAPYPKRGSRAIIAIVAVVLVAALIVTVIIASGLITSNDSGNAKTGDGEFGWTFNGKTYSIDVSIPSSVYQEYRNNPIQRYAYTVDEAVSMCDSYVTPEDQVVQDVAGQLDDLSAGFTDLKRANFVLSFVQNIEYVEDETSVSQDEYWRFPVETLYDEVGDCEDKAFLYASLMEAMGNDAVILLYDGHAAAGIDATGAYGTYYDLDGVEYYYCETTAVGWEVGDIPDEYGSAYIAQVS
jgi:transglutaminase-like putative cysteine protease